MPDQTLVVRLYSAATPLMQQFLDNGVLVKALDVEPLPQRGYYLCQPMGVTVSDTVREFYGWLQLEGEVVGVFGGFLHYRE